MEDPLNHNHIVALHLELCPLLQKGKGTPSQKRSPSSSYSWLSLQADH